ncbi:MAG: hypothetical protein HQL93_13790, partial [Magnetococcales bacterium]|nr:hypothetical protein [Magnetococcales bacterium]
ALILAAANAGFLVNNFPPAKIFMGDVGSVPMGFMAAALSLWALRDGLFDLWVPVLIFSPFIVDATVTVIKRTLLGEKFWMPHRSHYYQRLVLSGWSHQKTVLCEYILMVSCGLTATFLFIQKQELVKLLGLLAYCLLYLILAIIINKKPNAPNHRSRFP